MGLHPRVWLPDLLKSVEANTYGMEAIASAQHVYSAGIGRDHLELGIRRPGVANDGWFYADEVGALLRREQHEG